MNLINSYLSESFIEGFINNKPNSDVDENKSVYVDLLKLFCKYSNVQIGCPVQNIKKYIETDFILLWLDEIVQGGSRIKFDTKIEGLLQEIIEKKIHSDIAYSFQGASETNNSQRIGIATLLDNNYELLMKVTGQDSILISKNKINDGIKSWKDIKSKLLPYNSIVICDNYLFADYLYNFQANTLPFFNNLLSKSSNDLPVQITIFSSKFHKKSNVVETQNDFEIVFGKLNDYLKKKLGEGKYTLSICKHKSSDYHDRQIFTNSQFIRSGNSFSYFDNKGNVSKSTTLLEFIPYSYISNHKFPFANLVKPLVIELKKIGEKSKNFKGENPANNSLFDMFLKSEVESLSMNDAVNLLKKKFMETKTD